MKNIDATESAYKNGYEAGRKEAIEKVKAERQRFLRAVSLLEKEFMKAQMCDNVRDPLAYALYQTWKQVEEEA